MKLPLSQPSSKPIAASEPRLPAEVEQAWEQAIEGICPYCRWKSRQDSRFNRWFETHEHIDAEHPEAPYQKLPLFFDPELTLIDD